MNPVEVRQGVRALVTAYIGNDTAANQIAAELTVNRTDAYEALHELASLLEAVLAECAEVAGHDQAKLWQDIVLVDLARDGACEP